MRTEVVRVLLVCAVAGILAVPASASIPAFPGAEGAGAHSIGGRNADYTLYRVTNLDDSGPGSLREACQASGPRIVVFAVGGYITLERPLGINNPYITIAGQTAPGGGICLKMADDWTHQGSMVVIGSAYNETGEQMHDVIIRHLRFRPGAGKVAGVDNGGGQALGMIDYWGPAYNIIIDHCSLSWGNDQIGPDTWTWKQWSPAGIYDVTVQRTLIAEGLLPYGRGTINGGTGIKDVDHHHNLYMSCIDRHPVFGDTAGSRVVSNIAYNCKQYAFGVQRGSDKDQSFVEVAMVDWINNKAKLGPSTACGCEDTPGHIRHWDYYFCLDHHPDGSIAMADDYYEVFMSGNIGYDSPTPPADQWGMTTHGANRSVPAPTWFKRSVWAPLPARNVPITQDAAMNLDGILLPDVGACWRLDSSGNPIWNRDRYDAHLMNEYASGTGHTVHYTDPLPYPTLDRGTAYTDSDSDGLGDAWETAHFDSLSRDGKGDYDRDGYLDLEEFINVSDPQQNDSSLSSKIVYATSFTNDCGGIVSGAVADVQASDNSYLVLLSAYPSYTAGGRFTIDSECAPSTVSKIIVQIEVKANRTDTGKVGLRVYNYTTSTYDDVRPGELWQTGDAWMTWETTDISTYMDPNGLVQVNFGDCPSSGNSNRWELSLDTVQLKLYLNPSSVPVASFTGNPTLRNAGKSGV